MRKRPIWVWLICLYVGWSCVSSLFGAAYAFVAQDADAQWARDYYLSLSAWQIGYVVLNAVVALSAAVSLFLMRSVAAPLFTAVLVLGIANAIWQVSTGWIGEKGAETLGWGGVLISLLFGLALVGAIVGYVWWLRAKGRLV